MGGCLGRCMTATVHPLVLTRFSSLYLAFPLNGTHAYVKKLREGYQGKVLVCEDRDTGEKLREVILTHQVLAMMTEWVQGGDFKTYLRAHAPLSEDMARYFFRQMMSVIKYSHRHKVVHRDVKAENFLVTADSPPILKLIDFGMAKKFKKSPTEAKTMVGTPGYMSPEMYSLALAGDGPRPHYDGAKVDVWCCAVLLCYMLSGHLAYNSSRFLRSNSPKQAMERIHSHMAKRDWKDAKNMRRTLAKVSPLCVDLLDKMLLLNEADRASVDDVLQHPWMRMPLPKHLQQMLDSLEQQQAELDALWSMVGEYSPPGLSELMTTCIRRQGLDDPDLQHRVAFRLPSREEVLLAGTSSRSSLTSGSEVGTLQGPFESRPRLYHTASANVMLVAAAAASGSLPQVAEEPYMTKYAVRGATPSEWNAEAAD